jgi:hypothetical protein
MMSENESVQANSVHVPDRARARQANHNLNKTTSEAELVPEEQNFVNFVSS